MHFVVVSLITADDFVQQKLLSSDYQNAFNTAW